MFTSGIIDTWTRFKDFFISRNVEFEQLGFYPGVPREFILAAEAKLKMRFPDDYREFLLLCSGHDYERFHWLPDNISLYHLDETVKTWEEERYFCDDDDRDGFINRFSNDGKIRQVFYHSHRIPVAGIDEEGCIYLDLIPGPRGVSGQVIIITGNSTWVVLTDSFIEFLEMYITNLETGKLTIHRDEGLSGSLYRIKTASGNVLTAERFISLVTGNE